MLNLYKMFLVEPEDYYKTSQPKYKLFSFMAVYAGAVGFIWHTKQVNPEVYFKKMISSPIWMVPMAVAPFLAFYAYNKKTNELKHELYLKTVGHLTDREILELEIKINPKRLTLYSAILQSDSE